MKFRYDGNTSTIKSDDPGIFVRRMGNAREAGDRFLLTMGDRVFGFQTAEYFLDNQSERLSDGTLVWRIGVVLCQITRWDDVTKKFVDCTNTYKFQNSAEQDLVLSVFAEALSAFDGYEDKSESGNAKARVEYTDEIRLKVASGELIQ